MWIASNKMEIRKYFPGKDCSAATNLDKCLQAFPYITSTLQYSFHSAQYPAFWRNGFASLEYISESTFDLMGPGQHSYSIHSKHTSGWFLWIDLKHTFHMVGSWCVSAEVDWINIFMGGRGGSSQGEEEVEWSRLPDISPTTSSLSWLSPVYPHNPCYLHVIIVILINTKQDKWQLS